MSLLYICLWRCSDGFLFINAGFTNGFSNIEKVILHFFFICEFFLCEYFFYYQQILKMLKKYGILYIENYKL